MVKIVRKACQECPEGIESSDEGFKLRFFVAREEELVCRIRIT